MALHSLQPLIRAILRGVSDTTMAARAAQEEREELIATLNALADHETKLPDVANSPSGSNS